MLEVRLLGLFDIKNKKKPSKRQPPWRVFYFDNVTYTLSKEYFTYEVYSITTSSNTVSGPQPAPDRDFLLTQVFVFQNTHQKTREDPARDSKIPSH
jgi:hypothetical protein